MVETMNEPERKVGSGSHPRASGVELLRILAMLAIVAEHFIRQSPLMGAGDAGHQALNTLLGSAARISVNVFVMIGAWFMVDSRFKAQRIVRLYLEVVFYSVPITICMLLIGRHGTMRNVIQGMVPFFGRSVWFASAYISLMALCPFLNKVFELPRRKLSLLMVLLFVLFAVVSTLPSYSALDYIADFTWFCVVYLFIGWMKHVAFLDKVNVRWLALIGTALVYLALCGMTFSPELNWIGNYWLDNIRALPNVTCAFLAFLFFIKLDIGSLKMINVAAKSTFAVYVVHQVPAFQQFEWGSILRVCDITCFSVLGYAVGIICVAACVFAVISIVDWLRLRFIEPFYMGSRPVKWAIGRIDGLYSAE